MNILVIAWFVCYSCLMMMAANLFSHKIYVICAKSEAIIHRCNEGMFVTQAKISLNCIQLAFKGVKSNTKLILND